MHKKVLRNGILVLVDKKESNSVVIEMSFRVGSNYEDQRVLGISHFLEHLLFDGTKTRDSRQIAFEIERYGGEINALTSNERTSFYVRVPKKHFDVGLEILSDIILNPLFLQEEVDKEKNIIVDEINMVNDTPMFYQWILFVKTLFKVSNARHPVYGSKETIKALSKQDLLDYYQKHYFANNMIVSVTGEVSDDVFSKIEEKFKDFRTGEIETLHELSEPISQKVEIAKERKNVDHTYMVFGYKTPNRSNPDSFVLDIIRTILGGGMSSRLFNEIRLKRALAYTVGVQHDPNRTFGYFAVYLSTDKKNVELCKDIIIKEFKALEEITQQDLENAKTYIEGQFLLENEDNAKRADNMSSFEISSSHEIFESFLKHINSVKIEDVKRVARQYLNEFYTLVTIEEK